MKLSTTFLLSLIVVLCSCTKMPFADTYAPAELKQRQNGLYVQDFASQQKKFNDVMAKIKASPDVPSNYTALAQVYMYEARVTGEHPYYYPAALAALDEAIEIDKKNTEALSLKTSVLLSLHRFAEAHTLAKQLTVDVAGSSAAYGMLCDANVELGYYADAVKAADRMMAMRPGLEAYARVSYLREIHGDNDGAIDAMRMAVKAGLPGTEDAAWTRTTFGNVLFHQGKIAEAEEQYQLARLERTDYPFALAGLASVRQSQKRSDEAMQLLDAAIKMVPEVSFVEKKAEIEQERGNADGVTALLAEIETMMNEDEQAGHINYSDRALLYSRFNYKPEVALENARKDIAIRPDNITSQYAMAYALYRNGKSIEAKTYMDKALRMKTRNADMLAVASLINSKQKSL
ncbi:MAG: hypothetical protein SGJ05_03780 [bacterium]|nr:hypothetical protein [bacterium]